MTCPFTRWHDIYGGMNCEGVFVCVCPSCVNIKEMSQPPTHDNLIRMLSVGVWEREHRIQIRGQDQELAMMCQSMLTS